MIVHPMIYKNSQQNTKKVNLSQLPQKNVVVTVLLNAEEMIRRYIPVWDIFPSLSDVNYQYKSCHIFLNPRRNLSLSLIKLLSENLNFKRPLTNCTKKKLNFSCKLTQPSISDLIKDVKNRSSFNKSLPVWEHTRVLYRDDQRYDVQDKFQTCEMSYKLFSHSFSFDYWFNFSFSLSDQAPQKRKKRVKEKEIKSREIISSRHEEEENNTASVIKELMFEIR